MIVVQGSTVRLKGEFRDENNVLVDPITITFHTRPVGGTLTDYLTPIRDSVGVYHQDVTVTTHGCWEWEVQGTFGSLSTRNKQKFTVIYSLKP